MTDKIDREELPRVPSQQLNVARRVYHQDQLNKDADYQTPRFNFSRRVRKFIRNCGFGDCLRNSVPIVRWLPKYKVKNYLMGDFVAGATTAVLHVPQGMAYSFLAYCPPTVGLYMGFFPILVYVTLGSSPHVCLGTFAVTLLMAGKVVREHATIPELETIGLYTPVEVVTALTFTVAIIQLTMWCLRLGAVSSLLSEPLVSGLTTGAAFQVCASQFKDVFGIKLTKLPKYFKIMYVVIEIFRRISQANWAAFTLASISGFFLIMDAKYFKPWLAKKCRVPLPIELIVIIIGTLISNFMNLKDRYHIIIVGDIPIGLPVPSIPPFALVTDIFMDAIMVTLVTYTITLSMGLILADKPECEIDANQELLALGASNIFGCFFSCGPVCASLSRSYVQYKVGGKTLITSLISATWVLLVLLCVGPFFEPLPRSVLAAIVIVALKGLYAQVKDFIKFWKLSKLDGILWMATFLFTVLVQVEFGLVAGLLTSVGTLFFRSQTPYICLLGRVPDTDLYLDIKRYRGAHEIPGIKIFHYCGGLNFTSKNMFRTKLYRKIGYLRLIDPTRTDAENQLTVATSYSPDPSFVQTIQCVIIDASALSYVDAPGIKILVEVSQAFKALSITMLLAGANVPVLEMINRYNSLEKDRLQLLTFATLHDAVTYYDARKTGAKKQDTSITLQDSS